MLLPPNICVVGSQPLVFFFLLEKKKSQVAKKELHPFEALYYWKCFRSTQAA